MALEEDEHGNIIEDNLEEEDEGIGEGDVSGLIDNDADEDDEYGEVPQLNPDAVFGAPPDPFEEQGSESEVRIHALKMIRLGASNMGSFSVQRGKGAFSEDGSASPASECPYSPTYSQDEGGGGGDAQMFEEAAAQDAADPAPGAENFSQQLYRLLFKLNVSEDEVQAFVRNFQQYTPAVILDALQSAKTTLTTLLSRDGMHEPLDEYLRILNDAAQRTPLAQILEGKSVEELMSSTDFMRPDGVLASSLKTKMETNHKKQGYILTSLSTSVDSRHDFADNVDCVKQFRLLYDEVWQALNVINSKILGDISFAASNKQGTYIGHAYPMVASNIKPTRGYTLKLFACRQLRVDRILITGEGPDATVCRELVIDFTLPDGTVVKQRTAHYRPLVVPGHNNVETLQSRLNSYMNDPTTASPFLMLAYSPKNADITELVETLSMAESLKEPPVDRYLWAFRNGIFRSDRLEFRPFPIPDNEVGFSADGRPVSSPMFFDMDFDPYWLDAPLDTPLRGDFRLPRWAKDAMPHLYKVMKDQDWDGQVMGLCLALVVGASLYPLKDVIEVPGIGRVCTKTDIMPFLYGTSGTGKSTILNVIWYIYGSNDRYVKAMENDLSSEFALENLHNALVLTAFELDRSSKTPADKFNRMVSGENFSIARKHKTSIQKQWSARLVAAGNTLPNRQVPRAPLAWPEHLIVQHEKHHDALHQQRRQRRLEHGAEHRRRKRVPHARKRSRAQQRCVHPVQHRFLPLPTKLSPSHPQAPPR